MKKALVVLMLITLLTVLCSCDYKLIGTPGIGDVEEWISPDGVHYWMRNGTHSLTLTPRYDNDGNLVIEGR